MKKKREPVIKRNISNITTTCSSYCPIALLYFCFFFSSSYLLLLHVCAAVAADCFHNNQQQLCVAFFSNRSEKISISSLYFHVCSENSCRKASVATQFSLSHSLTPRHTAKLFSFKFCFVFNSFDHRVELKVKYITLIPR